MQAPWVVRWLATILNELPSPTAAWADIVGHLAWPIVTLFLVLRFRAFISLFLSEIVDRIGHDHVKIGPFELTPNSEVLVLDPDEVGPEMAAYVSNMENLFELIVDAAGEARLRRWIAENVSGTLELLDFVTEEVYAEERDAAVRDLIR